MKIFNKTTIIVAGVAILATVSSCKKLLVEEPRDTLYPSYLETPNGIRSAISGIYQNIRGFYSGENIMYWAGTDESIAGSSSGGQGTAFDRYTGINSSQTAGMGGFFADINTVNAVLEFAPKANLDVATSNLYLGQLKFLRAYEYFILVQTFGGTTATQKSGIPLHTTYIKEAITADAPAPMSAIYDLIIKDLTEAAASLPNTVGANNPFVGRTATAGVAKGLLAKVYLTRGYLSEIAQPGDFQKAADLTAEVIANKNLYGYDLFQDYNDLHKPANDQGKENMFNIDYGFTDPTYSGYTQQGSGGYGINQLYVLWRWNYPNKSGIDNTAGVEAVPQRINTAKTAMNRDNYNGRPYERLAPNGPYINKVYVDQVHDTRWDATFQTFWICNKKGVPVGVKFDGTPKPGGALVPTVTFSETSYNFPLDGDTAVLMPGVEVDNARRDAFKGLIVTPKQYSNGVFPTVKKFNDPLRPNMNDFSSRPIALMRFSEMYLMNAEANYMLNKYDLAAQSLNVLRRRAAYRTPEDALYIPKGQFRVTAATMANANTANAAAMELTGAQLAQLAVPYSNAVGSAENGMDLILDEYSRELFGDPRRWYDLVRTRQLVRRVKMYNANGAPNIQEYHMRRPIPQTLIQNVLTGPVYPQNNGY
jgi:hypothetical protein